jgi:cytochrome oxidase Cu insertion factor (SCO1/SenC/PrrC family)
MKEARAQLGSNARSIVFAIVNTDPRNIAVNPHPLALELPHLEGTPNVVFLTGSLHRLNSVWVKYGIRIKVGSAPSEVSHNNEIYFIGAKHRLEALATPFAKVSNKNVFSLSATYIARYAKGIAETAISLVE